MQAEYPEQVHVTVGFVPAMARRIYGGADMFLMPSQNEPCGLAQMVAMRYGTIPVVRETGGLKDSVFDAGGKDGNGFTFKTYDAFDMLDAVKRACVLFADKRKWNALVRHEVRLQLERFGGEVCGTIPVVAGVKQNRLGQRSEQLCLIVK